ncbi:MAG: biotin--[acetyl-CoA-carboxylase] ligase [Desulfobacteraceae bacterium]|nr:biotin--[acetyl-CoA-carboxylase] ligase [Desulfobacteraceae bacterium]
MQPGLYLLGSDKKPLFEAIDPDGLAGLHPAWEKDVNRLSPWVRTETASGHEGSGFAGWRSGSCRPENRLFVCGKCASTMDAIRELIACGLSPWDGLIAVQQQKGRGQMERTWISPPGNLYVSWYWPDLESIDGASPGWRAMASLLAGQVAAEALESFGADVRIKWPNDLLVNDCKICGILVEHRAGHLIVGIGINLATAPPNDRLTDAFAIPAVSLLQLGIEVSPMELMLHMAETGRSRIRQLVKTLKPEEFVMQLQKRLAWVGQPVTIRRSHQEAVLGEIRGLAADGGLIVRINGKTSVIYTGSILPAENIHI